MATVKMRGWEIRLINRNPIAPSTILPLIWDSDVPLEWKMIASNPLATEAVLFRSGRKFATWTRATSPKKEVA